ncbi:hypothetical protein DB30_02265 [Enhygromyxa salina]|uniref:Uncharacterized protein n=1 Tax=Enhygromyxa salina TaxID=215803 RepID=A0A0C1Z322_9BACT|nr:hypothetical protein [Enhygromyxa salina]KIG11964.1 hypothetical protein DB30_02265 [Enhygromyxa salina]
MARAFSSIAWAHPTAGSRFLHDRLAPVVRGFWATVSAVVALQYRAAGLGHGPEGRARIRRLLPDHTLVADMRSAAALTPLRYHEAVARGEITPHRGVVTRFVEDGIVLANGTELPCELVVVCLGSGSPVFPFMPARYRELLEGARWRAALSSPAAPADPPNGVRRLQPWLHAHTRRRGRCTVDQRDDPR